jgi:hypothetical protein
MPHKTITIQGEPGSRPVFDGSGMRNLDAYPKGQIEWMSITRDSAERAYEATNIVIRGLQVQNYLTAIAIRGGRSGERHYPASDGGNIIKDNRFLHIGGAYSRLDNGPKVSHAAIFLSRSRLNLIRNNDFINITNDAKFPPDYSTYGGLHAVYITSFEQWERRRRQHIRPHLRARGNQIP